MSTFFRVLAVLLLVAVAIGIGTAVYNAGVSAGFAEALRQVDAGNPIPVPVYGYGPYWHGPGIFGIFFWILGIFLVFALIRAAFGWGRWGGGPRGGWGPGGWGPPGGRDRVEAWHRELHRQDEGAQRGEPASS